MDIYIYIIIYIYIWFLQETISGLHNCDVRRVLEHGNIENLVLNASSKDNVYHDR